MTIPRPGSGPAGQTRIPHPASLWKPFAFWVWVFVGIVSLDAVPHLLVQYWFNQSLGYRDIFWTNLRMQAVLFVSSLTLFATAIALLAAVSVEAQSLVITRGTRPVRLAPEQNFTGRAQVEMRGVLCGMEPRDQGADGHHDVNRQVA